MRFLFISFALNYNIKFETPQHSIQNCTESVQDLCGSLLTSKVTPPWLWTVAPVEDSVQLWHLWHCRLELKTSTLFYQSISINRSSFRVIHGIMADGIISGKISMFTGKGTEKSTCDAMICTSLQFRVSIKNKVEIYSTAGMPHWKFIHSSFWRLNC